jgi:hypothetical protein
MKKLLFGCCALSFLAVSSAALAVEKPPATPQSPAAPETAGAPPGPTDVRPRAPSAELGFVLVAWGMAYTRSALGLNARYEAPLVGRPGVLWNTTNVAFGVRNLYGYVNNTLSAFVEVTPIAFFKLQLSAAYDSLIIHPASGGARVLTPLGEQKLKDGDVKRGDADAIDWVDGKDNRKNFFAPVSADGLRLRIQPTLQAKAGPLGLQYNFTADFNFYRAANYNGDAIVSDTFTFTLRKLRDFGHVHELVAAAEIPGIRDELRVGAVGKYYHVAGTGLDNLSLNALVFYRPRWSVLGERVSPWVAAQAGTNLIDPMHQYDFSWVLVLGVDLRFRFAPRTSG